MGSGIGRNVVFGHGEETTWNTPVVVNRFHEILSESLTRNQETLSSNGMIGGSGTARHLRRGSRRAQTTRDGTGGVTMEVPTIGFGRLIRHTLGGTPTVVQQGATTAYLQTHTMGVLPAGLTLQKQVRDEADVEVESFTFSGARVTSANFSIGVGGILQAEVAFDAADVVTSTAAAAVSLGNVGIFHWKQGTLKVGGSTVALVSQANAQITNVLKTDRHHLGSSGVKKQQLPSDFPTVGGSLSAEFDSPATFYDRYTGDTPAELILEFVGAVISGAFNQTFRITIPEVRFTGGTPTVGGPDVIVTDVPYEGFWDGASADVKVEYMSTDTAV